jgi:hypothetical protein
VKDVLPGWRLPILPGNRRGLLEKSVVFFSSYITAHCYCSSTIKL